MQLVLTNSKSLNCPRYPEVAKRTNEEYSSVFAKAGLADTFNHRVAKRLHKEEAALVSSLSP